MYFKLHHFIISFKSSSLFFLFLFFSFCSNYKKKKTKRQRVGKYEWWHKKVWCTWNNMRFINVPAVTAKFIFDWDVATIEESIEKKETTKQNIFSKLFGFVPFCLFFFFISLLLLLQLYTMLPETRLWAFMLNDGYNTLFFS